MRRQILAKSRRMFKSRQGIAMFLVLALGIIVLLQGMAMLNSSGQIMQASSDSKQMIRARYAAESAVSIAIADAITRSSKLYGNLKMQDRYITLLDDSAVAKISTKGTPTQELINIGDALRGMRGLKIPMRIEGTGMGTSGAKATVSADVYVYQVPIFQFGVFYENSLEITPGPNMFVSGRVHTNSDLYVRGYTSLAFQGPVTVSGKIWYWRHGGSGTVDFLTDPNKPDRYRLKLGPNMQAMDEGSQPPAVGGIRNVQFGVNRLVIPIGGGNPHALIEPRLATDNEDLKKQKYDWQVAEKSSSAARFVAGVTAKPSWIVGPRVFIDRREKRWVKCWYFDVEKLIASGNRDSIFYLADTTTRLDRGTTRREMINAFAIINSAKLPRNMTIASVNSIYQIGDFNGPVNPADSNSYYNAQVAGDAYTLISPQWWDYTYEKQGVAGSLEQAYDSLRNWLPNGASERWTGRLGTYTGTIRVHAALVSGNKQTIPDAYPPLNYRDNVYEQKSEGGWHNTIRFREDLGPAITVFKGSFICLWAAQGPYLNPQVAAYNTGFYSPPQRLWGFDTQFKDLNNMPPATPFLSSATMANWLEKR